MADDLTEEIDIEIDDDLAAWLFFKCHERDLTPNQLINSLLKEALDELKENDCS